MGVILAPRGASAGMRDRGEGIGEGRGCHDLRRRSDEECCRKAWSAAPLPGASRRPLARRGEVVLLDHLHHAVLRSAAGRGRRRRCCGHFPGNASAARSAASARIAPRTGRPRAATVRPACGASAAPPAGPPGRWNRRSRTRRSQSRHRASPTRWPRPSAIAALRFWSLGWRTQSSAASRANRSASGRSGGCGVGGTHAGPPHRLAPGNACASRRVASIRKPPASSRSNASATDLQSLCAAAGRRAACSSGSSPRQVLARDLGQCLRHVS